MNWTNQNKSNTNYTTESKESSSWTTDQNKPTTTYSTENKESSSWTNRLRAGMGWLYNHEDINYNSTEDPESGKQLFYDRTGLPTTWDNLNKS